MKATAHPITPREEYTTRTDDAGGRSRPAPVTGTWRRDRLFEKPYSKVQARLAGGAGRRVAGCTTPSVQPRRVYLGRPWAAASPARPPSGGVAWYRTAADAPATEDLHIERQLSDRLASRDEGSSGRPCAIMPSAGQPRRCRPAARRRHPPRSRQAPRTGSGPPCHPEFPRASVRRRGRRVVRAVAGISAPHAVASTVIPCRDRRCRDQRPGVALLRLDHVEEVRAGGALLRFRGCLTLMRGSYSPSCEAIYRLSFKAGITCRYSSSLPCPRWMQELDWRRWPPSPPSSRSSGSEAGADGRVQRRGRLQWSGRPRLP